MNPDDIKDQLKELEVFKDGESVYQWEPAEPGEVPYVVVFSKTNQLLWGHELLQVIADSQKIPEFVKLSGVDKVIAVWGDGSVEVMTDDETLTFNSREGWQTYWSSLDEWPKEIDSEGGK